MKENSFMQNWILALLIIWGIVFLGFIAGDGSKGLLFGVVFTAVDLIWHFGYTVRSTRTLSCRKRACQIGNYIKQEFYNGETRKYEEFLLEEDYDAGRLSVYSGVNLSSNSIADTFTPKGRRGHRQHMFSMDSAIDVYAYAKVIQKTIGDEKLSIHVYYGGYIGGNGKPVEVSTYRVSDDTSMRNAKDITVFSNVSAGSGGWYFTIGTEDITRSYFERNQYFFGKVYPPIK